MYLPAEDSFLLASCIKEFLKNQDNKIKILDMGSGSGTQAKTCQDLGFKDILCTDIDKQSLEHLKKLKLNVIKSDLFSSIKEKFDLILFNPPYLPEHKHDKKIDTTAGKKGNEIILKFLKQAKNHLNKDGKILLLFSSFSKPKKILKTAKELGYKYEKLAEKRIFFEKLEVWEISLN